MGTGLNNTLVKWATPLIGGAIIIFVVYVLLGAIGEEGLQVVATVLFFSNFLAFALGLQMAKAHTRGLEHGVDVKVAAQKRPRKQAANRDRFLPEVQRTEALIVTQDDGTDEPIDM